MEEFHKTYCLYHPTQPITNFCRQKTCLMPLCPTCICSHLQLHIKEGKSIPQFDNITDSLNHCYKDVKEFGEKFEQSRVRLNGIERSINDKKKDLIELIYTTKVQVRELVDSCFAQLEKQLETAIFKQNSALKLHLPEYISEIQKRILDTNSKLRQMMSDLKNQSSLGTLITYHHEGRAVFEKQQQQISKQIKSNQDYYPITNLNHQAINRLKQNLLQVITLKFNFPPFAGKTQTQERDNNLIGYSTQGNATSKIQGPRSPLSKITNAQVTSPTRVSHNAKQNVSPTRYIPKSVITSPSAPRVSMEGLALHSQMNP